MSGVKPYRLGPNANTHKNVWQRAPPNASGNARHPSARRVGKNTWQRAPPNAFATPPCWPCCAAQVLHVHAACIARPRAYTVRTAPTTWRPRGDAHYVILSYRPVRARYERARVRGETLGARQPQQQNTPAFRPFHVVMSKAYSTPAAIPASVFKNARR